MKSTAQPDAERLLMLVRQGRFRWHPTVPRNFECQLGCSCCCLNTFFFPSEERLLPDGAKEFLTYEGEVIRPRQKPIKEQVRCVFFDLSTPRHCLIHELRPLRCRLYPYLPLISGDNILVIVEPFLNLKMTGFGVEEDTPDWVICYGLGRGRDVREEVERKILLFLERIALERPDYIERLTVPDIDKKLEAREIEKHLKPKYGYYYEYGPVSAYPRIDLNSRLMKLAWEMKEHG